MATEKGIAVRGLKEAQAHLKELARRGEDQGPAWADIAKYLEQLTRQSLSSQGWGKWAPLAASTVERYGPHQIGDLTGKMRGSLHGESDKHGAAVTTTEARFYGRLFHRGVLGRTARTRITREKQDGFIGPKWGRAQQPARRLVPLRSKYSDIRIKLRKYLMESRKAKAGAAREATP